MSEKHLTTEDFDYDLPQELIAQTPLKERDQSRLLVLDSKTGKYQDDYFYNVIDRLNPGDALVMNDILASCRPVFTESSLRPEDTLKSCC